MRAHVYHSDQISTYVTPLVNRVFPRALGQALESAAFAVPRALSRKFDATIAPSRFIGNQLQSHGCERVYTVTFGIKRGDLGPLHADVALRRSLLGKFAGDERAALVIVACRLAIEKRVALVIDAVRELSARRPVALAILGPRAASRSHAQRAS